MRKKNEVDPVTSAIDWAYIAGFLDGEGYIGASESFRSEYLSVRIIIGNRDPRPLQWIQGRCGGVLSGPFQRPRSTGNGSYRWTLSRKDSMDAFLRGCLPYLQAKREQAELFLELLPDTKLSSRTRKMAKQLARLKREDRWLQETKQ